MFTLNRNITSGENDLCYPYIEGGALKLRGEGEDSGEENEELKNLAFSLCLQRGKQSMTRFCGCDLCRKRQWQAFKSKFKMEKNVLTRWGMILRSLRVKQRSLSSSTLVLRSQLRSHYFGALSARHVTLIYGCITSIAGSGT